MVNRSGPSGVGVLFFPTVQIQQCIKLAKWPARGLLTKKCSYIEYSEIELSPPIEDFNETGGSSILFDNPGSSYSWGGVMGILWFIRSTSKT